MLTTVSSPEAGEVGLFFRIDELRERDFLKGKAPADEETSVANNQEQAHEGRHEEAWDQGDWVDEVGKEQVEREEGAPKQEIVHWMHLPYGESDKTVLLWMRGNYLSAQTYQTSIVGTILDGR